MSEKRNVVGSITDVELNQIKDLFKKKSALENLIKIIDPKNEELFNRIMNDYAKSFGEFSSWWDRMSKKYEWSGQNWQVNFQNGEIVSFE